MRLSLVFTGLMLSLAAARSIRQRVIQKLVLSHYMVQEQYSIPKPFTNLNDSLVISQRNMLTKILTMPLPWGK